MENRAMRRAVKAAETATKMFAESLAQANRRHAKVCKVGRSRWVVRAGKVVYGHFSNKSEAMRVRKAMRTAVLVELGLPSFAGL